VAREGWIEPEVTLAPPRQTATLRRATVSDWHGLFGYDVGAPDRFNRATLAAETVR
jgi:hypothetical protein